MSTDQPSRSVGSAGVPIQTTKTQVLAVEAIAGLAEFVNDDAVRKAVIEHSIERITSFFRQTGDFAVAAMIGLRFEFPAFGLDLVEEFGDRQ